MTDTAAAPSRSGAERRQWPRFDALDKVLGVLLALDLPVRIRDVGRGGFSVETVEPLSAGSSGAVRFMAADNWTAVLHAQSLYCRPSVAPDGTPRYVTGFTFLEEQAEDATALIVELVTKVTSVRMFDA